MAVVEETLAIWAAEEPEDQEHQALLRAIDCIGWPEIRAFQEALHAGQDVREDAGGFFARAIAALLGIKSTDPILTYKDAARAALTKGERAGG